MRQAVRSRLRADSTPAAAVALLLTAPVPSAGTYLAMVAFPEAAWAKALFAAGKVWIIAAPVLWLLLVERTRPRLPRPTMRGMPAAVALGLAIVVCIYAAYLLVGETWIDLDPLRQRMAQIGLDHLGLYLLGALYWCTINSILEEYFWRWFVFLRLRAFLPGMAAVIGSALLFTAHHVIALKAYFPWNATLLASVGVFIGGATWSWLYLRYRNIYAAYVCHVFADVVIFYIGYRLIFG